MKMILKTFAIIMVVISSSLFVGETRAQTNNIGAPAALPAFLPMGRQAIKDWIVTNSTCWSACQINWTNIPGSTNPVGCGNGTTTQWSSYSAYTSYIASNTFKGFMLYRSGMNPNSQITFNSYVYNLNVGVLDMICTLNTYTNVGTVSTITSNTFATTQPNLLLVIQRVPNLQYFSVQTEAGYSYSWSPSSSTRSIGPPNTPSELTTNGVVILNEWYSLTTNRVRFTIAALGVTNRYTQFGELIQPSLSMNVSTLQVHLARGSDTRIESSPNLSDWTILTNIVSAGTNLMNIHIDRSQGSQFFRAISN